MAVSPIANDAAAIREALNGTLWHRATITPVVAGAEDAHGNATYTDGTPRTGVACKYRAEDRLRTDDGGRVTVSVPTLAVEHDDPASVGDRIEDIRDSEGELLLAGPLVVETVVPSAGFGPTLKKRLVLRGGDAR